MAKECDTLTVVKGHFSINLEKITFNLNDVPEYTYIIVSSQYFENVAPYDFGYVGGWNKHGSFVFRTRDTDNEYYEPGKASWNTQKLHFITGTTVTHLEVYHVYFKFYGDANFGIPELVSEKTIEVNPVTETWKIIDTPEKYKP